MIWVYTVVMMMIEPTTSEAMSKCTSFPFNVDKGV